MTFTRPDFTTVLERGWGIQPPFRAVSLGNAGGFSGAQLWRINRLAGTGCLRRWQREHPSADHLAWIHGVLQQVSTRTDLPLAVPLRTISGETFVQAGGYLWEYTAWFPGQPYPFFPEQSSLSSEQSSLAEASHSINQDLAAHLELAMRSLATFHQGVFHQGKATSPIYPASDQTLEMALGDVGDPQMELATELAAKGEARLAGSPGLADRWGRIKALHLPGAIERLRKYVLASDAWPGGAPLALAILQLYPAVAPRVQEQLQVAARLSVKLQPCVRDIWSDHLLFEQGRLSGWIDFGAMRIESVAADISRLLGSIARDSAERWELGLKAYEALRPLSDSERLLLKAFDASQSLLSGINWIQWIYVEQRGFEQLEQIEQRLRVILWRLQHLAKSS